MNSNRTCVLEPVNVSDDRSLWTTAQAALVLNRSERSVRRLVQQGTIAGHKVKGKFGEEWRIIPFTTESTRMKTIDHDENHEFSQDYAENLHVNNAPILYKSITPRPSLWTTIINLLKLLLSWNTRQNKMTSQTFETQN
ncbi:MAG: helix-turn-helix domain-containing protein [Cyanobacteria bacterium SZAS LIN-5]|nr:helix-turn-helix domain-containing protein [Cyanobacteria bacterium SZAS LIN-5]